MAWLVEMMLEFPRTPCSLKVYRFATSDIHACTTMDPVDLDPCSLFGSYPLTILSIVLVTKLDFYCCQLTVVYILPLRVLFLAAGCVYVLFIFSFLLPRSLVLTVSPTFTP